MGAGLGGLEGTAAAGDGVARVEGWRRVRRWCGGGLRRGGAVAGGGFEGADVLVETVEGPLQFGLAAAERFELVAVLRGHLGVNYVASSVGYKRRVETIREELTRGAEGRWGILTELRN